eukprot:g28925.t1
MLRLYRTLESGRQALRNTNSVDKDSTMKLLDLCLTTHFIFNGRIFKQINGTPMGSLIPGLIAKVVMQRRFVTMRGDIISGASDEAMLFYSAWNLYYVMVRY